MNMANRDRLKGKKTLRVSNFLDEFEKDDVKKEVDIIDLFASFGVKLSKKGKNYIGQCPWHDDASPSLSVDKAQGLYNCFGCGESGDIFTLTEKMKGYGFKEALDYLKKWKPSAVYNKIEAPVKESAPLPVSPLRGDEKQDLVVSSEVTLSTIADYYHKKLYDSEKATDYLKKRGLVNVRNYSRFKIGFADGSLLSIISESQKKSLQVPCILRDNGKEHFLNCLTFPILDDMGNTVGIYGRNINDRAKVIHLYLKGKHRGIFNRKASKVYNEIILTEGIWDALSLIELGLENVQSIYGTNGFTDEHLRLLKDDRVKTIIIAFDNDEAGVRASETLKEKLLLEGFAVKIIYPPLTGADGSKAVLKDWNDYLVLEQSPDAIKELIQNAEIHQSKDREKGFSVTKDHLGYSFIIDDIIYRVTGVKDIFISNLRVNVRAELKNDQSKEEPEKYYDNLDLYSARSRANYYNSLSQKFFIEPRRIEKDLIVMLEYLESERDKKLLTGNDMDKEKELTREEIKLGMEFLKSPDIFDIIVKDMEKIGYVGEGLNKELIYLAASSRILDDPISVLILSESAAGKTMIVDTVKDLLPPDEVIGATSLSDQALNYAEDLNHKFLSLGEAVHSEVVEHQIREMLSGKELSRFVTVKDNKTGKMVSKLLKVPATVSAVITGTNYNINPENASRCFVINIDESRGQTRRIQKKQKGKHSLERHYEKKYDIPEIIKKHRAAQRLLRRIVIVNSYSKYLDFPDILTRTRRDHDRFIDLIACVCFLRQYQKEIKNDNETEYIECDLEDYETAYNIMINGVLSSTMSEIPGGAIDLYEEFRDISRKAARRKKLKPNEISLTQREIREETGFGHSWIKQLMRILVEHEYIIMTRNHARGSRGLYRLKEDAEISELDLSMIPKPEDLKRILDENGK